MIHVLWLFLLLSVVNLLFLCGKKKDKNSKEGTATTVAPKKSGGGCCKKKKKEVATEAIAPTKSTATLIRKMPSQEHSAAAKSSPNQPVKKEQSTSKMSSKDKEAPSEQQKPAEEKQASKADKADAPGTSEVASNWENLPGEDQVEKIINQKKEGDENKEEEKKENPV